MKIKLLFVGFLCVGVFSLRAMSPGKSRLLNADQSREFLRTLREQYDLMLNSRDEGKLYKLRQELPLQIQGLEFLIDSSFRAEWRRLRDDVKSAIPISGGVIQ